MSPGALGAVLNEVDVPGRNNARGRRCRPRRRIDRSLSREEMENPIVPSVVEFINNIEYRDPD